MVNWPLLFRSPVLFGEPNNMEALPSTSRTAFHRQGLLALCSLSGHSSKAYVTASSKGLATVLAIEQPTASEYSEENAPNIVSCWKLRELAAFEGTVAFSSLFGRLGKP